MFFPVRGVTGLDNRTFSPLSRVKIITAVVETDGGRIRTRETECGSGTHNPAWKETKTALCMRMSSDVHEHHPAPEPPKSLQNRQCVSKLAKEVGGAKSMEHTPTDDDDSPADEESVQPISSLPSRRNTSLPGG